METGELLSADSANWTSASDCSMLQENSGCTRIRRNELSKESCNMENIKEMAAQECVPCKGDVPPLKGEKLRELQQKLGHDWQVIDEHHLEKGFSFKNFRQALDFTNKVGELAEQVGHHPDIYLTWGKVRITICTHKIDGLTDSDFVLAAKIEELNEE